MNMWPNGDNRLLDGLSIVLENHNFLYFVIELSMEGTNDFWREKKDLVESV